MGYVIQLFRCWRLFLAQKPPSVFCGCDLLLGVVDFWDSYQILFKSSHPFWWVFFDCFDWCCFFWGFVDLSVKQQELPRGVDSPPLLPARGWVTEFQYHQSIATAGEGQWPEFGDGFWDVVWVVVSIFFYFHPYLGKWSNLTNIFQMGWNHQLVVIGNTLGCPPLPVINSHHQNYYEPFLGSGIPININLHLPLESWEGGQPKEYCWWMKSCNQWRCLIFILFNTLPKANQE